MNVPVKLAVFDVDGTLLRGDTACQTVARGLGKYERMCEMEQISDTEQILAAREEMASWYLEAGEDTVVSYLSELSWAPGAREGIANLQRAGVSVALASVTWSFAVAYVAEELGIERFRSTGLDFETGEIDHAWGSTKAEYLKELTADHSITMSCVVAVGDSSGDLDMLQEAGLGIFVGSKPPRMAHVTHLPNADIREITKTILSFE